MAKKLDHYKNSSNVQLRSLIKKEISYSVLYSILGYNCTDIFTDNDSIIICYSNFPYPVWVYCKDINNVQNVSLIADCIKNYYFNKGIFNIMLSDELLEKLVELDDIFSKVKVKLELLSYKLNELLDVTHSCDGHMELANEKDLELLSIMIKDMAFEMEGFVFSLEESKQKALEFIKNKTLFAWKNNNDEIVALTSKGRIENYSKVSSVYTLPNERRKGYAMNLVYGVSKSIIDEGLTPILYTDGSNPASNDCYKKIGYKYMGRLVNIDKGE